MFFIIDGLSIKNNNYLDLVEDFMIFNSDHFIKTKTELNKYETQFMKNYKNVSLV